MPLGEVGTILVEWPVFLFQRGLIWYGSFRGWYEGTSLVTSSNNGSIQLNEPHTLVALWEVRLPSSGEHYWSDHRNRVLFSIFGQEASSSLRNPQENGLEEGRLNGMRPFLNRLSNRLRYQKQGLLKSPQSRKLMINSPSSAVSVVPR